MLTSHDHIWRSIPVYLNISDLLAFQVYTSSQNEMTSQTD